MLPLSLLRFILTCEVLPRILGQAIPVGQRKYARQYKPLSDLSAFAALPDPHANLNLESESNLLSKILVPRAAGSQNLSQVQDEISSRFEALHKKSKRGSWAKIEDTFTATTPIGPINFRNLVFTHNPEADLKFVLAAHTDSVYAAPGSPMHGFVGATDSAAPCAILVDVAEALSDWLDAREDQVDAIDRALVSSGKEKKSRLSLTLLFLDGEEAFENWSATDSIYGARSVSAFSLTQQARRLFAGISRSSGRKL